MTTIVEGGFVLKIATGQAIGITSQSSLNPENMSSGSATLGQVPSADGVGGITWSDEIGPVPSGRQILNGTGITGGGDLSADRTLSVVESALDPANMSSGSAGAGQLATASGGGAVSWADPPASINLPVSSTDHALTRWNGTGGDTIQDSNVTLSDAGAMVFPSAGSISKPGTGGNSEAFGASAVASATFATALGRSANSGSSYALSAGYQASASGDNAVALGRQATNTGSSGVTIGATSTNDGANSVAIGAAVNIDTNANCVAIGLQSEASDGSTGTGMVAVGNVAKCGAQDSVAVGRASQVYTPGTGDNTGSIAIGAVARVGAAAAAGCNASIAIGENSSIGAGAADSIAIGPAASASAASAVVVGEGSSAAGVASTVLGRNSSSDATSTFGVVVGATSSLAGNNGVVVGGSATASGQNHVAVGQGTSIASTSSCVAVGYNVVIPAAASGATAIGATAVADAADAVVIGKAAKVHDPSSGDSTGSVAIGTGSEVGNATPGAGCNASIAIGENSSIGAGAADSIAIGPAASASGGSVDCTIIGPGASVTGAFDRCTVAGHDATAAGNDTLSLGNAANASALRATAVGGATEAREIQSVVVGYGAKVYDVSTGDSSQAVAIGFETKVATASGTGADAATVVGSSSTVRDGASNATLLGYFTSSYGANTVVIGQTALINSAGSGDNTGAIAIGSGVDIGTFGTAGCQASICIGEDSVISPGATNAVVAGPAATAGAAAINAVAIGNTASVAASSTSAVAIGNTASANGFEGVSIGSGCATTGSRIVGIGGSVVANADNSTAVGHNAESSGDGSAAYGRNSLATQLNSVAVGSNSKVYSVSSGDSFGSVAIGSGAVVGNSTPGGGCNAAVAIGEGATVNVGHTDAVAIGAAASSTAASRVTFASTLEVEIGQGLAVWGATPPGSQPAKINDVTATAGASYTATEQGMLNDLKARLNSIIDVLEGAGLSSAT
jgi:hypothetical protein